MDAVFIRIYHLEFIITRVRFGSFRFDRNIIESRFGLRRIVGYGFL